jgi:hypothetical protein
MGFRGVDMAGAARCSAPCSSHSIDNEGEGWPTACGRWRAGQAMCGPLEHGQSPRAASARVARQRARLHACVHVLVREAPRLLVCTAQLWLSASARQQEPGLALCDLNGGPHDGSGFTASQGCEQAQYAAGRLLAFVHVGVCQVHGPISRSLHQSCVLWMPKTCITVHR